MKKIAIIGSTGSIGQNALEVIRLHPEEFSVCALIAKSNGAELARQAREFRPAETALADDCGAEGVDECLRACGADVCLSAASGLAGLQPTLTAIDCGMEIALANKETLVAAGELIMPLVREKGVTLRPVDSEHSAIAQCLRSGRPAEVSRLVITGSGGPFREWPAERLAAATAADALKHPTWSMGRKITVDSATLANKALEVIEAHHLFAVPYDKISVYIHPQSVVHGAVEFADGAVVAQLANPDMRLPILYALAGENRRETGVEPLTLEKMANLTFTAPDLEKFPMLRLGLSAGRKGGLYPAVYSAANEMAVGMFLEGKIGFPDIARRVARALEQVPVLPLTLENIKTADADARKFVRSL